MVPYLHAFIKRPFEKLHYVVCAINMNQGEDVSYRPGENGSDTKYKFIRLARTCGVYKVFLAGKSPNIQSYMVYSYGFDQPYVYCILYQNG
jgi:hypothetical protein